VFSFSLLSINFPATKLYKKKAGISGNVAKQQKKRREAAKLRIEMTKYVYEI
jgi:hypothetical protein